MTKTPATDSKQCPSWKKVGRNKALRSSGSLVDARLGLDRNFVKVT